MLIKLSTSELNNVTQIGLPLVCAIRILLPLKTTHSILVPSATEDIWLVLMVAHGPIITKNIIIKSKYYIFLA